MRTETRAERSSMETGPRHLERDKYRAGLTDYVSAVGIGVMVLVTVVIVGAQIIGGTFL